MPITYANVRCFLQKKKKNAFFLSFFKKNQHKSSENSKIDKHLGNEC